MNEILCVGIDLGTTNSCVAIYGDGRVEAIEDATGAETTASVVSFENKSLIFGSNAKERIGTGRNTFYSVKRIIGRHFSDPILQNDLKYYNFDVESDSNDRPVLHVNSESFGERKLYPEMISALVLNFLLNYLKKKNSKNTNKAVITVPANFNDYQRRATIEAGKIAGFDVIDVLSEPTAAAICHAFNQERKKSKETILVFDFGGGTLDVSILDINELNFVVRSTAGNSHLGGDDIDNLIIEEMVRVIKEKEKINLKLPEYEHFYRQLRKKAEQIKVALSSSLHHSIPIPIPIPEGGSYNFVLNRATLYKLCNNGLIDNVMSVVEQALNNAKLKKSNINSVVMVGGSSSIPFIREKIVEYFGKEVVSPINPMKGIACGAAIYGTYRRYINGEIPREKLNGLDQIKVADIVPMTIGFRIGDNKFFPIVTKGTVRPYRSPLTMYNGRAGCDFFRIKIYEGEGEIIGKNHILVSEHELKADEYKRGLPAVKLGINVTNEQIEIVAESCERLRTIKIDTKKDAHTQEEINEMKNQMEELLAVKDMKDEDIDEIKSIAKNQLNKLCRSLMKTSENPDKGKELQKKIKQWRNRFEKEGTSLEIIETLKREFEEWASQNELSFRFQD